MKLLFDANLSHKLVGILAHEFPDCAHVRGIGLLAAEDSRIWDHARTHGHVIVSKDTDFRERSFAEGFPPKVVWLNVGNSDTLAITGLLHRELLRLERFVADSETALLILPI